MAVCLTLSAKYPAIQIWRPLYLVLTVIIVCSQKVDTTLSKGVLRIVASILGGVYGECHTSSTLSLNTYMVNCHSISVASAQHKSSFLSMLVM